MRPLYFQKLLFDTGGLQGAARGMADSRAENKALAGLLNKLAGRFQAESHAYSF